MIPIRVLKREKLRELPFVLDVKYLGDTDAFENFKNRDRRLLTY